MVDRPVSVVVGDDAPTVAAAIDVAPPNTTVVVPTGTYTERVEISKPLTLRGHGSETLLSGDGQGTVVTVNATGVAVTDLRIEGVGTETLDTGGDAEGWDSIVERTYGRGDAGVAVVDGSRVVVSRVHVDTPSNGILVRDADDVVVTNVTVRGDPTGGAGYMGVMAMRSPVVVRDSEFSGGLDGVYAHRADGLVVQNSTMRDARFGVHLMFTSDALVAGNAARNTSTGVVVMTRPSGNAVVGNDVRASSHGVVTAGADSYVARNVLVDNDVGLKIGSRTSLYRHNVVARNGVGVEATSFVASNRVVGNDFVDNDRHARAPAGPLRLWATADAGNYWDTAVGLGADGSLSRPYRPTDPLDARLDEPGTTTLARAPVLVGLRALQGAVPGMRTGGIVDTHPEPTPVNPARIEQAEDASLDFGVSPLTPSAPEPSLTEPDR
jgi:nitrous oxidase accessory protein NosD